MPIHKNRKPTKSQVASIRPQDIRQFVRGVPADYLLARQLDVSNYRYIRSHILSLQEEIRMNDAQFLRMLVKYPEKFVVGESCLVERPDLSAMPVDLSLLEGKVLHVYRQIQRNNFVLIFRGSVGDLYKKTKVMRVRTLAVR